jgi:hypothetical protein
MPAKIRLGRASPLNRPPLLDELGDAAIDEMDAARRLV